jgi:cobalamin synthase
MSQYVTSISLYDYVDSGFCYYIILIFHFCLSMLYCHFSNLNKYSSYMSQMFLTIKAVESLVWSFITITTYLPCLIYATKAQINNMTCSVIFVQIIARVFRISNPINWYNDAGCLNVLLMEIVMKHERQVFNLFPL